MSKFICCYLEENYGMTLYNSKDEFVEHFKYYFVYDEGCTFEELLVEMKGIYEVIEVKDNGEVEYIVEE
jgi:hypothetical protein